MAAPHYTPSGAPVAGSAGSSADMRNEFALVEAGIDALNLFPMCIDMDDINTAGSVFLTVPWACTFESVYCLIDPANGTGATSITFEIGGVAVTMSTALTIPDSAALYSVHNGVAASGNALVAGTPLEIVSDGGSTGAVRGIFTLLFART